MLRVTVDLVPFGRESERSTLEELIIYNTGTHENRPRMGNYVAVYEDKHVRIEDWDRNRNTLELVEVAVEMLRERGCLKSAGPIVTNSIHSMKPSK